MSDSDAKRTLDYLRVDDLLLDPENPRLVTSGVPSQDQLLKMLYELESLDELASSFADNGYFAEEPLVVVPGDDGKWIVVEGNRRLATLKLLLDPSARATLHVSGWPNLDEASVEALSVVPCVKYRTRSEVFPFLGFRHITGAKKWAPFQRARFIDQLIADGRSLSDIEDLIGDTSRTVKKLYQDYIVFNQITEDLGLPEKRIRDRFSLLEVTLGQRPIKAFLGIPRQLPTTETKTIVPEDKLDELEEVVGWVFGTEDKAAVISDSRTITSRLAPVLASEEATAHLRATSDLDAAYDYSAGEKAYLLKRIQSAERALRDIAGLAPVYEGDDDVRRGVERIGQLADALKRVVIDE